jgi:hypothetical protein
VAAEPYKFQRRPRPLPANSLLVPRLAGWLLALALATEVARTNERLMVGVGRGLAITR